MVGQLHPRELVLAAPILQVALEALIHLLDANAGAAQAGRVLESQAVRLTVPESNADVLALEGAMYR